MKLQHIDVDGFGVLSDLSLRNLADGVNVIYGANGSGKTTLLHFLRGVCCGFADSRKIGLLPPADGSLGGGSVRIEWDGDICRLVRHDEPGERDQLRVTLVRNDLEATHPRFDVQRFRCDLVPLLFTVGAADVHAVERLVIKAVSEGIPLIGSREPLDRFNAVATQIHNERSQLLQHGDSGRVRELAEERHRLQSEVHRLTAELRTRCERSASPTRSRLPDETSTIRERVIWLREELAAAESDLWDAEERAWRPQPAPRSVSQTPAAAAIFTQRHTPKLYSHIEVQRVQRLEELDRQMDHARTLLAQAARARLDLNLRFARIAGSDDTAPEFFLNQVRDSLKSLEVGVLELRDDSEELSAAGANESCACDKWQSVTQDAISELTKRLYQLCEQVSGFELGRQKSSLSRATATINECELQILNRLDALRTARGALLDASGRHQQWKGSVQALTEHANCRCAEHKPRLEWRPQIRTAKPPATDPPPIETFNIRPSAYELQQLRERVIRLRQLLETATSRWRTARNWRPGFELHADIRASERRIDEHRIKLHEVESAITACQQRWRVLSVAGEVIRRVVDRIERDRQPTVIQWASQFLRRLTEGCYSEVSVSPDDLAVEVVAADGSIVPMPVLSRGTRDQLTLCLRLALTRAYASRGVHFPMVLDDVLADTDQERLREAVSLLAQFAREHNVQILYFTCQTHLADLFELQGASIRTMPGSTRRDQRRAAGAEGSHRVIRGWVDRRGGGEVKPSEPTSVERTEPLPPSVPHTEDDRTGTDEPKSAPHVRSIEPLHRRQPGGPYWLSFDAPIDLVPSIGSQMGRRLADLSIHTAGDLIDLDAEGLPLRLVSLQITSERLQDWRAEALLLCCVPDLTGPDAQLLVASGIREVRQLANADAEQLIQALITVPDAERKRVGYANEPSCDVVQRWILSGGQARRLRDARRFSSGGKRTASGRRSATIRGRAGRSSRTTSRRDTSRTHRRRRSSSRASRGAARQASPQARRDPDRQEQPAIIKPFVTDPPKVTGNDEAAKWKFYLSPQNPIVDAPSIGPTTAKRLEKIGILTVADLLSRPAAEIAARMNNRRVKEETVQIWQQQARLMSRIPQLRGHDAQVLVACGVTEPEQVAAMTPEELYAIVGPFVATKEGQRLLRSSNTPDLAEVTDWITWAGHSRTLRAA